MHVTSVCYKANRSSIVQILVLIIRIVLRSAITCIDTYGRFANMRLEAVYVYERLDSNQSSITEVSGAKEHAKHVRANPNYAQIHPILSKS